MDRIEADFVILGAGWSGLLSAFFLSKVKGSKVVILEKEDKPGGLARTLRHQGCSFDLGGHALFFKNKENISFLKELTGDNKLIRKSSKAKIFLDGNYLDYPPNLNSIISMDKRCFFWIMLDILKLKKNRKNRSFKNWIVSNYGETLYRMVFKDYTQKVWGLSCDNLSSLWAKKRIGNNNLFRLLGNFIFRGSPAKEYLRYFYYPQGGAETLVNSLLHSLKKNCRIFTGVSLEGIQRQERRLVSLNFTAKGRPFHLDFKEAVSTIPLTNLLSVLPDVPFDIMKKTARGIKYRSLILISFVFKKNIISDWYWCYFPSANIAFSRVHEPKFWDESLAERGKTLLCTEIFCQAGDDYWNMDDQCLVRICYDSLIDSGLIDKGAIFVDSYVKRIKYAYPLPYAGYEKSLNNITGFLRNYLNLHLIGRNGTHSYADMEECLIEAKNKTRKIIYKYSD